MKKITFILFALIAGTGFAQTDAPKATANASADIVSPITIDQVADLNFGKVVPSSTESTTIIIAQNGTVSGTGNSINTSVRNAAEFTINATDTYVFAVNVPETITLIGSGTDNNMDVDLNPSLGATGNTSEGDEITLLIGGTLTVGMNQSEGNYTTTFDVSVAYE